MKENPSHRHPNHLSDETSPYLLQHRYNPVDWYPWGERALQKAQQEHKPILLSIGYMACHWCHVMERESFEDSAIAELMNRYFVCIKVDKEERPDLDEVYMAATTALNQGHGGWPMTVFLTPEQHPFFAGTYFPPDDRYGQAGFATLLRHIAALWEKDSTKLLQQADQIVAHLQARQESDQTDVELVAAQQLERAVQSIVQRFDPQYGGIGAAPKFPPHTTLSLLLRSYYLKQDPQVLTMITTTLDRMAQGGLYDQLAGGFSRYSVDAMWRVPHFEKMLYDNALLLSSYLETFQVTGNSYYRQIAVETADFILQEMRSPLGPFYSAIDADSEGEEGKYYVWTKQEIDLLLPASESALFCCYYDITSQGNWEGCNILHLTDSLASVAAQCGMTEGDAYSSLQKSREILLQARGRRVPPATDDKVVVAWNGLMVSALAKAGQVLQQTCYLTAAQKAADFILEEMYRLQEGLFRTYRAGRVQHAAYLEDYAYFIEALISLYVATTEERYLLSAFQLTQEMVAHFFSQDKQLFEQTAPLRHQKLYLQCQEGYDGVTPNPNAVAALVAMKIGVYFDRADFIAIAKKAIAIYSQQIDAYPHAFATSLLTLNFMQTPPQQLVLIGQLQQPSYAACKKFVDTTFLPHLLVAYHEQTVPPHHPIALLHHKTGQKDRVMAYFCSNQTCAPPVTSVEELRQIFFK